MEIMLYCFGFAWLIGGLFTMGCLLGNEDIESQSFFIILFWCCVVFCLWPLVIGLAVGAPK